MSESMRADWQCKIVLIGDSNVGKTCLMRRYTENTFSPSFVSTIGIDFKLKMVRIKDRTIKVQIWDTAGQEKFRSITTAYYRGAKGIFVIYDVTNAKSFEHVSLWVKNISRWANAEVECMLLGNKCDREDDRQVLKKDGERISRTYNMPFAETSAKTDCNVEESFMQMLETIVAKNEDEIRKKLEAKSLVEINIDADKLEGEKTKKSCCK